MKVMLYNLQKNDMKPSNLMVYALTYKKKKHIKNVCFMHYCWNKDLTPKTKIPLTQPKNRWCDQNMKFSLITNNMKVVG